MFRPSDKQFEQQRGNSADAAKARPLDETAERELIERARALDEDAWAQIYASHAQQVFAYIYFRLGDHHIAEDLAGDVFVKAIAGIKRYSYRGTPLLAWLYRIAHNVTVDYRKSASKRTQLQAGAPAEDIEDRRNELQMLDDRKDMLRAIRQLTDDQQQVVILRFYADMSNASVARIVGKPEGAVKALQTRALRSLKRLLAKNAQAGEQI